MNGIDSLNSSLYFAAASAASQKSKEKDKLKTDKAKKSSFTSMMEKSQELDSLASAGLPVELAGMTTEEAVVFLKDAVDMAADKLSENMTAENFAGFRKSVGQFLKYIEKNNFEVTKKKRFGSSHVKSVFFEETRPRDPLFQVRVVDQKLNELAVMVMQNHSDKLRMLSKVDEIKGLLVDFFAD